MLSVDDYDKITNEARGLNVSPSEQDLLKSTIFQEKIRERYVEKHGDLRKKIKKHITYIWYLDWDYIFYISLIATCVTAYTIYSTYISARDLEMTNTVFTILIVIAFILTALILSLFAAITACIIHLAGLPLKNSRMKEIEQEILSEYNTLSSHRKNI